MTGPTRSAGPAEPRLAALRALLALARGVVQHLDEWDAAEVGLAGPDAGLARELILGCATYARLYDALADRFLRPGSQPDELRIALRIAAHQLFALDRVPAHAAVATAVEALKDIGNPHLAGVANAVGRKLAGLRCAERAGEGPLGRLPASAHPGTPGLRHGLPDQLLTDLAPALDGYGDERIAALNRRPELCTRSRPGVLPVTGASVLSRDGPWTWWGDPREALAGPVADGRCVVQDRSQGLVAEAVLGVAKAQRGDLVLDLCAAPGGKALALRDAGLTVIAADLSAKKATAMPSTLPRAVSDGLRPAFAAGFAVVLVDAPCSNTGVLGRRPEARLRYDRRHRDALIELQRSLLRSAAELVAAEGRLVYSTCSLVPLENQGVAHALAGWRLLGEHTAWPDRWQAGGYHAVLVRAS